MFIEKSGPRTFRSRGARYSLRGTVQFLRSEGITSTNVSYKHLAALRPGHYASALQNSQLLEPSFSAACEASFDARYRFLSTKQP
jgi:hypothetical protein